MPSPVQLELEPGEICGTWKRIDGWEGYKRARALLSHGDLYVGLQGTGEGTGAIYALRDREWRRAGGLGNGWSHGSEVHPLILHDGLIYAGVASRKHGAQLWCGDGSRWERVGHWPDLTAVSALASYKGRVITALYGDKDTAKAPILAYDGQWVTVRDDWEYPYICGYDIHEHAGELYVGFYSPGWFGGHVWRISGDPELIGGTGIRSSWDRQSMVLRLRSVGQHMVALMNREPQTPGNFANAWAYDGEEWAPLPPFPPDRVRLFSFNALMPYRGKLIVGAGGLPAWKASILSLDGVNWTRLGGKGVNGSWSPTMYRDQNRPLTNSSATEYVYQFCVHDGDLVAGFGATVGCGQVWRFSPAA